jgi:hypothetical protein
MPAHSVHARSAASAPQDALTDPKPKTPVPSRGPPRPTTPVASPPASPKTPVPPSPPFPPPALPGFIGTTTPSDSHRDRRPESDSPRWVSPVSRITFPTCRAHYPGGSDGCTYRLLPPPCSLPRYAGGSASATSLSRPAQASLALRPFELLDRPRRPLSRGFDPASRPAKPLVSYQTYRQLSGWILPPLVIRAFRGTLHNPG